MQLLVVFDDFEQNLTPGGEEFADPAFDDILTGLADAAGTGGLLVTCRYPLPGPDRFLARIPVPRAVGGRAAAAVPAAAGAAGPGRRGQRRVLARAIGGHPRLIEFTDALLRGGRSGFRHVQARLRDLARRQGLDLAADRSLDGAVEQALLLGSADILLDGPARPAHRRPGGGAAAGRGLPRPDDPGRPGVRPGHGPERAAVPGAGPGAAGRGRGPGWRT